MSTLRQLHASDSAKASCVIKMANLISRSEFRTILNGVVNCLRENLDKPGVPPLTPEEIHFWLHEVTMDDVLAVVAEIEGERNRVKGD